MMYLVYPIPTMDGSRIKPGLVLAEVAGIPLPFVDSFLVLLQVERTGGRKPALDAERYRPRHNKERDTERWIEKKT